MKTTYRVVVEYQGLPDMEFEIKLRKAAKKESEGSGFGFGVRDISFSTNTEARAGLLASRLRAVRGIRKKVTIYRENDNE